MQKLQEMAYPQEFDYRAGSPHLKHPQIYEGLLMKFRNSIRDVSARGLSASILEVGAGDGGFVEPALAYGCTVTATEMSHSSIDGLVRQYGQNPHFRAMFDEDGSQSCLDSDQFSLVLYASVLHHIPDYTASIDISLQHLATGGAFLSFQDPLWYPSLSRFTRTFSTLAYRCWRITQGNYVKGFSTLYRRLTKRLDEGNLSDMVEYHVVRQGVDHSALVSHLTPKFEEVSLMTYWSTQSSLWQRIGEMAGIQTTFAITARGFKGNSEAPRGERTTPLSGLAD